MRGAISNVQISDVQIKGATSNKQIADVQMRRTKDSPYDVVSVNIEKFKHKRLLPIKGTAFILYF